MGVKEEKKSSEYEELKEKASYSNYLNGKLISKTYTKEELEEKRKYFESLDTPGNWYPPRWKYEIERVFRSIETGTNPYPDCGLAHLERVAKYPVNK